MRMSIIYIFIIFFSALAQSQENQGRIFSFKGIPLNTEFSEFPGQYKNDCGTRKTNEPFFCIETIQVGEIPMDVEFYFNKKNKLQQIEAYFPRAKFNLVILSLDAKYGKQDHWDSHKYVWYSTAPDLLKPPPDEITVLIIADSASIASIGKTEYKEPLSVIKYESNQYIREAAIKRERAQNNQIKIISDDL